MNEDNGTTTTDPRKRRRGTAPVARHSVRYLYQIKARVETALKLLRQVNGTDISAGAALIAVAIEILTEEPT